MSSNDLTHGSARSKSSADELVDNVQELKMNEKEQSSTNPSDNSEDNSKLANDENDSDIETDKNDEDNNQIDEEILQDLELTLTPEEIEKRHGEALLLKEEGNKLFKEQCFEKSIQTYTTALNICPLRYKLDRSTFYCNRAAAKIKINRIKSAISDCSKAIELNPNYVRAYFRRAKLYEDNQKLDESLEDYKKILEHDPGNKEALAATVRLPPLINERNEKMKTEMLGKLKDLGNLLLRPFGLSTENFQVQQDPNSGGYSINFNQNKS